MSSRHDQISLQRSNMATRPATSATQKHRVSSGTKDLKDVLEYKIEDLSRQLAEERQASRQSKMTITRLQKDLRSKSHEKAAEKEQLSNEIENEKMLRVEAERHLHEMTRESEACHSRIASLQEDFKKMESLVRDVMQYKDKIDQLKQEKCSLSATYEANIQKFKGHISDLEWENMMLLNDVKKLESQINSNTEGHDKYNLLLDRLRMVEGENSSLVLENEQQRGKYEKCLDEIANQVVQALLAQKMLREECLKLQNRVRTLEFQNHHICTVFQQRMKMIAAGKTQAESSMHVEGSMESLQSMHSEQTAENSIGMPQMISPQSWVHECLPGDRNSIISFTGSIMSDIDIKYSPPQLKEVSCRTEIETEFPATPSSPKSKHVNFVERENENKHIASSSAIMLSGINRTRSRSTSSLIRTHRQTLPQTESHSHTSGNSELINQQPHLQNLTNQQLSVQNLTNQQSGVLSMTNRNSGVQNQGKTAVAVTDNKKRSIVTMTNKEYSTNVPLSHSDPSITSQISQRLVSPANHVSKLPVHPPSTKTFKEQLQLRRNSLKAEYSIRLENQSPISRDNQANSPMPTSILFVSKPSEIPAGSNNNSKISAGYSGSPTSHLRPPSTIAGKSSSSGSKIPTVGKQTGNSLSSAAKLTHFKEKTAVKATVNKQTSAVLSKLVPPKSPTSRYSGIRTTLKTDISTKTVSVKTEISNFSQIQCQDCVTSNNGTTANVKTVHSLSPVISSEVVQNKICQTSKPSSNKIITNQPHFPIMGLTTLNHISPKSENDNLNLGTNIVKLPTSFSSTPTSCNQVSVSGTVIRGQYFYDYSDEDSDSCMPRPMSKSFSVHVASPNSLLNYTLANTETSTDSDFSNSSQVVAEKDGNNEKDRKMSPVCEKVKTSSANAQNGKNGKVQNMSIGNNQNTGIMTTEAKHRMSGKPDIVKDTEKCELRNLHKSSPVSQISGSSMPHYRAKRPKSLVLWADENRFIYSASGLLSSPDASSDEITQKNVKEQEVISKVVKCVENNTGKVLESSLKSSSNMAVQMNNSLTITDIQTNKSVNNELQHEIKKSNLQKPSVLKKPSKIPPPVANKPSYKKSLNENNKTNFQRPKSMEIGVNTALSVNNLKSCYSCVYSSLSVDFLKSESENYLITDGNKNSESERCLVTDGNQKLNYSNLASTSTFDEVKVERSGSKDDGYSTMSSDIQPENIEKFSDTFENFTNSNDVRNSNLSLSSQNSVSSEDKLSGNGSLGRVKAMKLVFESEHSKHATNAMSLQSPITPIKSGLKPPKPILEKLLTTKNCKSITDLEKEPTNVLSQEKMTVGMSKIPKAKQSNVTSKENKPKGASAIVDPIQTAANKYLTQDLSNKLNDSLCITNNDNKILQKPRFPAPNPPVKRLVQNVNVMPRNVTLTQGCSSASPTSTSNTYIEPFDELTYFSPTEDGHAGLRELGFDGTGSLTDKGSDLTLLHISEDNILSDIPEEKDGYDSSVGGRSENTSITSIPKVDNVPRHLQQTAQHSHASLLFQFTGTRKCYWSSCQGIVRAISNSEYEKQKWVKGSVDCEELYSRCVNIETLLERSSSESDMFNRGDKPAVALLPKLQRSQSAECLVDEIAVEERVQDIMKNNMMQQISDNVKSADKDGETFTNFVELLIQKGHVMDSKSHPNDGRAANVEFSKALNKMAVVNISSNQSISSYTNDFIFEEKPEAANEELLVLGEEQKRFNSKFYSLCNTGSNHSISEKSENKTNEFKVQDRCCKDEKDISYHICQNCKGNCNEYQDMRNPSEFDIISHQLHSLTETVNQLHRSLSSLNSDNTDNNSESNEGDVALTNAIGNKDIDGYHWVEDEIFLSPYGEEITQGLQSPFLISGTSCDWINDYSSSENDNNEQLKANGEQCDLHEGMNNDFMQSSLTTCRNNYFKNSVLANSIDKEGNFNSYHFISQRLLQEEERRESMKCNADITAHCPFQTYSQPSINYVNDRGKRRPLLKEDTRVSPEKDTDDMEHVSEVCNVSEQQTVEHLEMMMYGGSQDSLDDNIGVDNMMCHRLIGGQGHCVNNVQSQLEFTNTQFICHDNPDAPAKSAFNLVNNTSLVTSERPLKTNNLHGQNSKRKSGLTIHNSQINQSGGLIIQNSKMNQSTTSEESTSSPVKRQRRKLRQRSKAEFQNKLGFVKIRKFSSNSTDESNDETSLDSCSDSEDEPAVSKQLVTATSKMTYV